MADQQPPPHDYSNGLDDADVSGNLDCTLLESLFYNEMIKMDHHHHQLLFSQQQQSQPFGGMEEEEAPQQQQYGASTFAAAPQDPLTQAEQALLRDFGVMDPTTAATNVADTTERGQGINREQPPRDGTAASSPTTRSLITQRLLVPADTVQPLGALQDYDDDKQRNKLLAQFTTLASRLGIDLPAQLLDLQSLTSKSTEGTVAADEHDTRKRSATEDLESLESPLKDKAAAAAAAAAAAESSSKDSSTTNTTTNSHTTIAAAALSTKRRKKSRLSECDAKLAQLQEENAILQSRLAALHNQTRQSQCDRQQHADKLSNLLQHPNASPQEIQKLIDHYQELYSDYGRRRHLELQWHLTQLERLANPTNVTKMGLYTLGQGPLMAAASSAVASTSSDAGKGSIVGRTKAITDSPATEATAHPSSTLKTTTNPIVGLLQKELGITGPQSKKILEQRAKIRTVCANLRECLALLNKLKELCEQKTRIFHDRLSKCREILTPEQVLKLLVWIHEHNETVSQACPGWGSEHLPAAVSNPAASSSS